MFVLVAYGIPESFDNFSTLTTRLKEAVTSLPELYGQAGQLAVFYPSDRMSEGLGEEIAVFVDGLFMLRQSIKDILADKIGLILKDYFGSSLIAVFVKSFDEQMGFWLSSL